ncbi:adenylate/guanylate cyclase domain-containing protein [soil metagenome]
MGWVNGAIGGLVVFVAIGLLIPIFIDPDDKNALGLLNGPLVAGYVALCGVACTWIANRFVDDSLAWLTEDRAPSAREHRQTLRLATFSFKLNTICWIGGVVTFFAVNAAAHSWEFGAVAAATIWLGGEAGCALDYLMAERILRPVTARALAARPPDGRVSLGVRWRLGMTWLLGTGAPLLGVLVVAAVGLSKPDVSTADVGAAILFLGIVASVSGVLATVFAAGAIADPLTSLREGLERVERGELDSNVAVDDGSEVGQLQAGFNRMAEGLREREQIRDLFGRQVGEDVARAALRGGTRLGGEEREVGAFFVDLVGSTSMAVAMPPTEVVRLLNRFFHVVVEVVEAECGLVNKFEGDAALCVFGAPTARTDPAGDALRAARNVAERLTHEVPEVDFGIGISAGIAVAGNVGAENRFEYTVIGDPINEAARLSELAKQRPERVLASVAALDKAAEVESAAWTITENALLRGRTLATGVAHPRSAMHL